MPPPLTDYTYAFGETGFIINSDSIGLPFVDVDTVAGLDEAPTRLNTAERSGTDGTFVDASYQSMRTVVITGTLYANTFDPDTLCDLLKQQFAPNQLLQPFYFKHPGKSLRFVVGQGGGAQYDITSVRRLGQTPIQLTVLCGSPDIFDYPANFGSFTLTTPSIVGLTFNSNVNFLTGDTATFESTIGNWVTATNCTIARSTAQAHSGVGSLAVTSVAAGSMNPASNSFATGTSVSPGDIVTGSIWFRANTVGRSCNAAIDWSDINNSYLSTSHGTNVSDLTTGWVQGTVSGTAPANAVRARLAPQVVSTGAAGEVHFYDDASMWANGLGFNVGFGGTIFPSSISLPNSGTKVAYPIFVITGPVTNPRITDNVSNITMQLNITLTANDTLIVDCKNKTITLNGQVSRRTAYNGLLWFSVPANTLDTFFVSATSVGGSFSATLYNTYY